MAMLTVRKLSDEVHRALHLRAARRGRSMEAEVRAILEDAVKPDGRIRLGSLLTSLGQRTALTDEEFAAFTQRDKSSGRPVTFE